jgi:hypothetical protein
VARSAGTGTILLRNFALGASTPWKRIIDVVPLAVVVDHLLNDESVRGTAVAPLPVPSQDVGAVLRGRTIHFTSGFGLSDDEETRQQEDYEDAIHGGNAVTAWRSYMISYGRTKNIPDPRYYGLPVL